MALILTQQVETRIPIEVPGIVPDQLSKLTLEEIKGSTVWLGRERSVLGDLFDVQGNLNDDSEIVFRGLLTPVHGIGSKMLAGIIRIESDTGRRVGAEMSGGEISVEGSVSDFLGVEMRGGMIRVNGDAGDAVGGHLPGSKIGMNRGNIFVRGDAGKGVGEMMRRGTIVIGGNAGELVGWNMRAGTIVVMGDCGSHAGAEMKRGTIVLADKNASQNIEENLLPTFGKGLTQSVPTLRMLSRWIEQNGFETDGRLGDTFHCFHGDLLQGGRGEIFVRAELQPSADGIAV